ncbi:MAG: FMN-binding protein [Lentisphaeria bacterium]|nr:FMN-binding protein [Lentisphaeria bacterium]
MKNGSVYCVVFTVLLSSLCAALLALAHTAWSPKIQANERYARTRALVDAMGLLSESMSRKEIISLFDRAFRPRNRGELEVLEARREGELLGYALDVLTQGKYGPIKAVLSITPDEQAIKAFRVYQQNETPGLGGRISEPAWQAQFSGKPLVSEGMTGIIISNTVKGVNVVDAISGASKTTYVLGQTINTLLVRFLSGGMALEPLDLGLTADAVTRSTPGYPKNLQKPPHLREEVRRPDFMVPPGVTNLAFGKPVTGSMDEEPIIGELAQITDGVKKSGEFDFVELDPGPQWVQVDLGSMNTIHCIVVWHYYKNPVIYNDVIVQTADDPEFTQNVRTLFNNDHDDSSGQGVGTDTAFFARWWGELVDTRGPGKAGTPMRCIRVWTNGGCGDEDTRFVEIQAFGK